MEPWELTRVDHDQGDLTHHQEIAQAAQIKILAWLKPYMLQANKALNIQAAEDYMDPKWREAVYAFERVLAWAKQQEAR